MVKGVGPDHRVDIVEADAEHEVEDQNHDERHDECRRRGPAHAFGARVLAADALACEPDGVAEPCSLERLLAESDVVSLHLPPQSDGRPVLDASHFAAMKPGAMLVNAARGGLVDEAALADAIRAGKLAGAALDTFSEEPYQGPLRELSQVVLTAHMGSYAEESRGIMEREAAENLYAGLARCGLAGGG